MSDQTFEYALALINKIREAWGLMPLTSMPKGIPGDPCQCPVARALRLCGSPDVSGNLMFNTREEAKRAERAMGGKRISSFDPTIVVIPDDLSRFIDDFDNERYPELIAVPQGGTDG